jgi:hypothetical protein
MKTYGIFVHEGSEDSQPRTATVMYRRSENEEGPWYEVATCDIDWAWEILNALQAVGNR